MSPALADGVFAIAPMLNKTNHEVQEPNLIWASSLFENQTMPREGDFPQAIRHVGGHINGDRFCELQSIADTDLEWERERASQPIPEQ